MSFVLGFKDSLRCLPCLATGLSRASAELRDHLCEHVSHRECFSRGWQRASEIEGFADGAAPGCLFPEGGGGARSAATQVSGSSSSSSSNSARATPAARSNAVPDGEWDAGDLGCGDLVLELRHRMNALRPGQTFKLTARDPGAPADLPAWCGLTGHVLLSARHPVYHLERRKE